MTTAPTMGPEMAKEDKNWDDDDNKGNTDMTLTSDDLKHI